MVIRQRQAVLRMGLFLILAQHFPDPQLSTHFFKLPLFFVLFHYSLKFLHIQHYFLPLVKPNDPCKFLPRETGFIRSDFHTGQKQGMAFEIQTLNYMVQNATETVNTINWSQNERLKQSFLLSKSPCVCQILY